MEGFVDSSFGRLDSDSVFDVFFEVSLDVVSGEENAERKEREYNMMIY